MAARAGNDVSVFGTPRVTPYFRGGSAYLAEPSGVKVALVLIGNWEVNYTEIKIRPCLNRS